MYRIYEAKLSGRHEHFKKLISILGPLKYKLPKWKNMNDAILYSIIGQMLSVKAANSIINNLKDNFKGTNLILDWASKNKSKNGPIYGVSKQKRRALAAWNNYLRNNRNTIKNWPNQTSHEVRGQIIKVWGLGNWAADMIMIFHLGKMDIWPESDGGIQRGVKLLFPDNKSEELRNIVKGAETVAALYIWQMLNKKIEASFS